MNKTTQGKTGVAYYVRGIQKFANDIFFRVRTMIIFKRMYLAYLRRNGFTRRFALCYPEKPDSMHALYAICHALGLAITSDPRKHAEVNVHFEDTTFRSHGPLIESLMKHTHVVNARCRDISKEKVEEIFSQTFGYSMRIDPRVHRGVCVRKSNKNALHDGRVVQCPTEKEPGYIYQKLINNQEGENAVDLRLMIFNDKIPFGWRRFKRITDRFDNTIHSEVIAVREEISGEEERMIISFCRALGLEYGEIDVLRDKDDGKLYIVDANNTPYAPLPGIHVSPDEYWRGIATAAHYFETEFMKSRENRTHVGGVQRYIRTPSAL